MYSNKPMYVSVFFWWVIIRHTMYSTFTLQQRELPVTVSISAHKWVHSRKYTVGLKQAKPSVGLPLPYGHPHLSSDRMARIIVNYCKLEQRSTVGILSEGHYSLINALLTVPLPCYSSKAQPHWLSDAKNVAAQNPFPCLDRYWHYVLVFYQHGHWALSLCNCELCPPTVLW